MKNYCLNDFVVCEEHYQNFKKVQNKNDSKFYYLKKYPNKNLDEKKKGDIFKMLMEHVGTSDRKKYALDNAFFSCLSFFGRFK